MHGSYRKNAGLVFYDTRNPVTMLLITTGDQGSAKIFGAFYVLFSGIMR